VQQWPRVSKKLCLGASKHTVHRCSKNCSSCPPWKFSDPKAGEKSADWLSLAKFSRLHFLLQWWEEPPLVDLRKLAWLVYVAPYLIVQAYYTCNLNPVEIKLLASNVSNGEIPGLWSKYHRRTWINKNWVVQTVAFPSGPGWEKQRTPQYEVGNPVWYIWDFHLPNIDTILHAQPQKCESTQITHSPFL